MALTVRVIAPDKTVWNNEETQEIILPSTTGQLGILPGHAPLLTALDIGVMRVRPEKDWISIALMGGFAEVEDNVVTVLVNSAERGDTIDKETARVEFEQAEEKLKAADGSGDRQAEIQAKQAFKRARARLQAAGGVVPL